MAPPSRILLVKTSSLGDVIHNLPVATDIRRALPNATIDWVCEPPYAPLVALHPAVNQVLPLPLRPLKKRWYSLAAWREFRARRAALAAQTYDLVLDTQGLAKSAWIAGMAKGPRAGYDAASAREPLAARHYQFHHAVSRDLHAVVRNRTLAGAALGYVPNGPADYGLGAARFRAWPDLARPYAVFLHATSRADKQWATRNWIALGQALLSRGLGIVLPWGAAHELVESERIAHALHESSNSRAWVPPPMGLASVADVLAFSQLVVGVDTGLAHLAVALDRPTVGLYCATDPGLTGLHGGERAVNLGGIDAPPEVDAVLAALARAGGLG
ncbi:MAG: lipopolysaccharide heptosyltransferase I [Betaproteobacteria bacterium]|nr:lipopolysaccharide heptosyltransferase I [Betaproteobacteria bacterium]